MVQKKQFWVMDFSNQENPDPFPRFAGKMASFDDACKQFEIANDICKSEPYQKIYRERKHPFPYQTRKPKPQKATTPAIIPGYSLDDIINMLDVLHNALEIKNMDLWNEYEEDFFDCATKYRKSALSDLSVILHEDDIWGLQGIARGSKDRVKCQDAFLKLVELDPVFITVSPASKIIREATIENDLDFFNRLSNAIKPRKKPLALSLSRSIFALHMLSSMGYSTRKISDWSEFFKGYNEYIRKQPDYKSQDYFGSFENPDTLYKAIKKNKVEYVPQKPGPKSR